MAKPDFSMEHDRGIEKRRSEALGEAGMPSWNRRMMACTPDSLAARSVRAVPARAVRSRLGYTNPPVHDHRSTGAPP